MLSGRLQYCQVICCIDCNFKSVPMEFRIGTILCCRLSTAGGTALESRHILAVRLQLDLQSLETARIRAGVIFCAAFFLNVASAATFILTTNHQNGYPAGILSVFVYTTMILPVFIFGDLRAEKAARPRCKAIFFRSIAYPMNG
jgi:hypothetical protein